MPACPAVPDLDNCPTSAPEADPRDSTAFVLTVVDGEALLANRLGDALGGAPPADDGENADGEAPGDGDEPPA